MKRFFIGIMLTLSLLMMLSAHMSASEDDDRIKDAILGFLDASFKGDTDRVLSLTCTAQRDFVRLRFPATRPSFVDIGAVNVDVNNIELNITQKTFTQAYITVAGDLQVSGGGQSAQPIPITDVLPFPFITTVLEDGQWLICNSADLSLRGVIEAGAMGDKDLADSLLCEPLRGTIEQNPFYQLGVSLGANADFSQITYQVIEWNNNNGFVKITSNVGDADQLRVVNAIRENGAWRICNTPETTVRMMLELAISDDFANASALVCEAQRDTVTADLRSLRQRIISLVNLEAQTAQPAFYEAVAVLIFEAAGVERRDFRIQVNQVQYTLSDKTDTSATIAFGGSIIAQTIGLRQNIATNQVLPASAQVVLEDGAWHYCPQSTTEEDRSSDA